jgi:hypothetical protein
MEQDQYHIVHGRLNQFADYERPFRFEAEVGKTVAEIVAAAPETPDWFWHSGEVRTPRSEAATVRRSRSRSVARAEIV